MRIRYVEPAKTHQEKRKKKVPYHIIVPSAIATVLVIIILICFQTNMNMFASVMSQFANNITVNNASNNGLSLDPNLQDYNGSFIADSQSGSVAIPGFDKLRLKPNTTKQSPGFFNPESNTCYFVIELRLSEDNTLLYKSGLIPPGKAIYDISILQPLQKGTYNASIIYKCYSFEGFKEMNGAEVKITLEVS